MGHRDFTRWPSAEGYAGRQSVTAGETVDVHASSRVPQVEVEVARLGLARTVVWTASVTIDDHPVPELAWRDGCDWPVAFSIPTGHDWAPGLYVITLTTGPGANATSEAFVVVRAPDSRRPSALFVLSTNTWQAYNQWGGRCLYSGAHEVSFRRPIERGYITRRSDPDGYDGRVASAGSYDPTHQRLQDYLADNEYPLWTASSGWHSWERRFAEWAETRAIDLDYAVDADLDRDPRLLDGRRVVVFAGHSEYWSSGARDHVDAFVESGGNVAVLSGNTCFWQVRYSDGQASMICYKADARAKDPLREEHPALLTSMWSDPLIGRPETSTLGLTFTRGGYHRVGEAMPRGPGGYTVEHPEHWVFEGTGVKYGDVLGAEETIVGYEVDGCALRYDAGHLVATGEDGAPVSLEVLGVAPARLISITPEHCEAPVALWAGVDPPGDLEWVASILFGDASPANTRQIEHGHAVMATFTRPGGGSVFHAGSADWCRGLDTDPIVEQITANVLRRFTGDT
jgi:hypothetical protein